MRKNAFCIHAHFYQPPRENPFSQKIPDEPGAAPFCNWNERIYSQCYKPNADIENFSRISFNIGPTLAEWMDKFHPETMQKIIDQEKAFYQKNGVSNGIAQAYNHTILPLASYEDKVTQVRWGIMDFEHRFGHKPQGLWLPETAVDKETLCVLADEGIQFTILAPWQAKTKRKFDNSIPYRVDLPNGKDITVFFYEANLSMKVSFLPEATVNADEFLKKEIQPLYPEIARRERLFMIASDGELYGHHQPFREKFLHWLTTGAIDGTNIEHIVPALWIKDNPAKYSMKIAEKTSWSCHHGIKRWCGECSCAEHGEWKGGLRRAFNRIAKIVDNEMQEALNVYHLDLLSFRNEYGLVLTGQETAEAQLERLIGKNLDPKEKEKLLLLMQAQYERQRMFASCGWFFGDFDRIEAQNNIAFASKAIYLTNKATGKNYAKNARHYLSGVKSYNSGLKASVVFDTMLKQNPD